MKSRVQCTIEAMHALIGCSFGIVRVGGNIKAAGSIEDLRSQFFSNRVGETKHLPGRSRPAPNWRSGERGQDRAL
jgi:hypothetical protein